MATTSPESCDDLVIGSGQAGNPLALALAGAGRKTVIVERLHVGGTCVNVGCTPTKTMVASGRVAYLARRAADYGVHTGPVQVKLDEVRRRKRAIVDSFRGGGRGRLEKAKGVELVFGEASFIGPKSVEVRRDDGSTRRFNADRVFVNAGCRPAVPPLPGLDTVPFLDSSSIMELDSVPAHLVVLGGGYIGLEFGQMFRRFGSAVTVVQRGERLLSREDPDVADAVAEILKQDGLELLLNTEALRAETNGKGGVRLGVRTSEGEHSVAGSHLLVATGRVPNTGSLNLSAAGIATDARGYIRVNERLETNVPGVYALGDINGGPAFTHISYDDFRIIRTNLLQGGSATTAGRLVPYTVFIDPQLGRIGPGEQELREQGRKIRVARMPMNYVARALETDESRGLMKAVVDADTGLILGGAVLGIEGGELMSMLQIAIMGKVPFPVLRDAVFAHPTLAESFNNLFGSFES